MRWAFTALVALSACYSPTFGGGAPCDPARDSCPTGQSCVAVAGGGVCMRNGTTIDAGGDAIGNPDGGAVCLGGHLVGSVCLAKMPTTPVSLTGTITTGAVAATTGCTEIHTQTGGPSICIIAGTTIDIPSTATVRAIALNPVTSGATATNPLVLVATQSITIEGTLDASSHFMETAAGGVPALGAGARTPTGCLVTGVDGPIGTGNAGGGGGAGGSFGGAGAAGGNGGNNNQVSHGNPAAASPPTVLVGGCPGGHGGDGAGAGMGFAGGGAGGTGGGAIYLLAGDSIMISGKINVSGSGGEGGSAGNLSSGGGGGGASGGMIGLEATRITVSGSLFANGGGGGAGGGNDGRNDAGKPGADPTSATTVASGGSGTNNGGNGGNGFFNTTPPTTGKNGSGSFPQCGGGGGGGGAGAIRVYGVAPSSIGGTVSPAAN